MADGSGEGTSTSEATPRQRRRVYLWIGLAALLVRAAYFSEHVGSAFFGIPILDERFYDELARRLLSGNDPGALNPGFRPWLYGLFLALAYGVGGEVGFPLAIVLQHVLGLLTCLLVCRLAMDWYGRAAAGWLAGGLYVLAGPPLFFEGEVLITTLFTLLATLCLWALLRATTASGDVLWHWALVGALLAVTAQARPNILLLCMAVPVLAWWRERSRPLHAAAWTLSAATACVGVLAAFGLLQQRWVEPFQLLPQSGGINFYLGNARDADGMQPRQDEWISYGDTYRDSVQVFAEQVYQRRTGNADAPPRVVSSYWRGQAMQEVAADPVRWLGLMGRKVAYLLSDGEIPNNKSYDFVRRHESVVLGWLPVRWGLLLALGMVGWWILPSSGEHAGRRLTVGLYLGLLALGILLFFVNGRFRIPLWPVWTVLAAGGAVHLWELGRRRSWRRGAAFVALAAALWITAVAVHAHLQEVHIAPLAYRDYFYRSLANQEKGQLENALADVQRSLAILEQSGDEDAAVWFQQGNVALALDDDRLAFESYRQASRLTPDEPRIFNNMGILHERQGRWRDAYEGYRFALALSEDYAPALVNLALLELRAGELAAASHRLWRAIELGDRSVPVLSGLAFLAKVTGRPQEAQQLYDEAQQVDAEATQRILMQLEQPLRPEQLGLKSEP